MKAYAKNIRISPKKLRVVVTAVRGMELQRALDTLRFMPKKGAKLLYKVLASAKANALHNDTQDSGDLAVESIIITKGFVLKRGNPVGRGRYHRILKRSSNIAVQLQSK